jgi:hypothetical protein
MRTVLFCISILTGVALVYSCGPAPKPHVPGGQRMLPQRQADAGTIVDAGVSTADVEDEEDCTLEAPLDSDRVPPTVTEKKRPFCCQYDDSRGYFRMHTPYCRLSCDNPDVYCVTLQGDPLDDETIRPVVAGSRVLVRVVDPKSSLQQNSTRTKITLRGSTAGEETIATYGGRDGSDAGLDRIAEQESSEAICHGACREYRLASFEQAAPEGQPSLSITLLVEPDGAPAIVNRTFHFPIISGRRWVEVGLQVPVTFKGTREISTTPLSGTGLSTLEVDQSLSWALAASIMVSPLGVWATRDEDPRSFVIKHILAPLSIGVGSNIYSNRRTFTEGYLSLNYRISADAFLGFGVSAVRGQYLTSTWQNQMLLPNSIPLSSVVQEKYMFRPMLAVTVSATVFSSLAGLVTRAQSSPQGTSSGKSTSAE